MGDALKETRIAASDGVSLSVRDWEGPTGAPSLLLLHGLASSSRIFDLVAPVLSRRFRVVAYDQRGHGLSSKPGGRYGFPHVVADALAVIRALRLKRPVVCGHSWGANVALELAVARPVSVAGAILIDGGFIRMRDRLDWPTARELLRPPAIDGMPVEEFLARFRAMMEPRVRVTPEIQGAILSIVRVGRDGRIRRRLSVANHLRILRSLWEHDPIASLRSLRVPTLILAARLRSPNPQEAEFIRAKLEAADTVRRIGGQVRFEWIESIHDVPLQRPAALARRIERFVNDVVG